MNETHELTAETGLSATNVLLSSARFLVGVFIIGVNCVTIFTFATVERLRTLGNMLVVSLAVTDLMVGLIMPLDAVNWMPEVSKQLQTSEMWCVLRLCWLNIGCIASFLNIVFIATDRYLYIVHPFLYARVVTSQKMLVTIVIAWVLAILWGTVIIYDNKFSEVKLCDPIEAFSKGYAVYGANAILMVCFTITAVLYTLIFRLALSKLRTVVPGIPRSSTNKILHQQLQVAKQSLAVFLVFAMCWTPHYVIYLVHVIAPQPYRTRAFATTVGFVNSGLNFFIYVIFNRAFRTKIKVWMNRVCPCAARPGDLNPESTVAWRSSVQMTSVQAVSANVAHSSDRVAVLM